jgi:tRNA threonylcarbamoyladenosine biosynthesis protein TsaE
LGRVIGQAARGGEVLALFGDLGTGKTVLVRGLAAGLGAPPVAVASPTFVLIHEYRGRLPLAHADLYRIEGPGELTHLGLDEYLNGQTVLAVEWADKAGEEFTGDRLEVRLSHRNKTEREIAMVAKGERAQGLLARVAKRWRAGRHPGRRRGAHAT